MTYIQNYSTVLPQSRHRKPAPHTILSLTAIYQISTHWNKDPGIAGCLALPTKKGTAAPFPTFPAHSFQTQLEPHLG